MIYSPFLLSVGMIGLLVLAVVAPNESGNWQLRRDIIDNWRTVLHHPVYRCFLIFFLIVFIGGFYSENINFWIRRLQLKLPFLLLPFAFVAAPKLERQQYLGLYYFLVAILTLTCIGIGINYALNFEAITDALGRGRSMPTPRNHIRFSLMMAIGIIAGAYLFLEKFYLKHPKERWWILGMTLFLFGFIHILSVRSGVLVLYISIFLLILYGIFQSKRYILGIGILVGLAFLPFLAYQLLPGFKQKVDYTRWNIKMYQEGTGEDYSDAERLISLKVGWSIFKNHPWLGVGTGDIKDVVKDQYQQNYPTYEHPKNPHNQFLSVLATHGIIGLGFFLWAFFYPLFYQKNYRHPLLFALYIIIFFSFMMENTLETSIGLAIYLFFVLFDLKFIENLKNVHSNTT